MIIAGQQAVSLTNCYQTDHISSVVQTHYLDFVNGIVILCITINFSQKRNQIDQSRYIKSQPKTIDLRGTRPWGITTEFVGFLPKNLVLRSIVFIG